MEKMELVADHTNPVQLCEQSPSQCSACSRDDNRNDQDRLTQMSLADVAGHTPARAKAWLDGLLWAQDGQVLRCARTGSSRRGGTLPLMWVHKEAPPGMTKRQAQGSGCPEQGPVGSQEPGTQ